jgi:malonate transporter
VGGVLIGFGVIAFVILVGFLLAKTGVLSGEGGLALNRTSFFAATPALLFTILVEADLGVVFSPVILVAGIAMAVVGAIYVVVARTWFTRDGGRLVIGAFSAGYVNINNIGLPVAIYVIGDAEYVAPIMLLQLLVFAPTLLGLLDYFERGRLSLRAILTQPFRNPILIASVLGVLCAVLRVPIPAEVLAPLEILGGAAVPLILLAFGASLGTTRPLQRGTGRREVVFAAALKAIGTPAIAFVIAHFVLRLPAELVYVSTILAALPTAQNMFQYAVRYNQGVVLARDVVLLTTFAAMPVMLVIAALRVAMGA